MKSVWLENLNLSETELRVMDALLNLKMSQSITLIAAKADLPRTTTLYVLKKFQKRKLAKRVPRIGSTRKKYNKRFCWRKGDILILK